jgi:hypothetical protein
MKRAVFLLSLLSSFGWVVASKGFCCWQKGSKAVQRVRDPGVRVRVRARVRVRVRVRVRGRVRG